MQLNFRPYRLADRARALEICVAAFTPIHDGFRAALGEKIFRLQYENWKENYARIFDSLSQDDELTEVYVVEAEGRIVGFVFVVLRSDGKAGEIGLNAVDPRFQRQRIGRVMYEFALDRLRSRGAEIAYVGTGGDAAHAPARKAYETAGFDRVVPGVHYFKVL